MVDKMLLRCGMRTWAKELYTVQVSGREFEKVQLSLHLISVLPQIELSTASEITMHIAYGQDAA